MQSTLPGLFVAGDGAGIGGKDVARLEGQLACLGAARQLGRDPAHQRVREVNQALERQRRFAAVLDSLFPFRPDLIDLVTDDTPLCRCEEIAAGEVRRAIEDGATTVNAIRMVTRAGMGRCQGRLCSGPVAELLAREIGQPVESVGLATPRPPILPVPLHGLIEEES